MMPDGARRYPPVMAPPIVLVGVPTALGGQLAGMEKTPSGFRSLGLVERLRGRPGLADAEIRDAGDVAIEPGFRPDEDPRAKNREAIAEFLPRERDLVAEALRGAGPAARLFIVGGDCTAHAGALAGLRLARPADRFAIAWFDAHGDFNTPDTTPSGNTYGMPFAMLCGRGDADLVGACDGPSVAEEDAALLGGQVLDEEESRMLTSSRVAHFGAGMLGTDGGIAALEGWARAVGRRVDGIHVAIDLDCLDQSGGWALTTPEPNGLALETAVAAVSVLAGAMPVAGFGATGITLANGDAERTADAVAELAEAALVIR
jgi:arginase